jgi:Phage tail tube protein
MAISKKAWTGSARESTPGTAVITPTVYIPTKATFKGGKKREYLNEERGDRNANYGVVDSVRQSSIEMKGPWYNDASPILLWAGMGLPSSAQVNASAAPTVYKHTFQLQDIPPSYTINRNLDAACYYIPYSVLEKWTLSFTADGKLLEVDGNWLGLYAQQNGAPPTPSYSTVNPFAGYAPTIKFIDGATSNDVADMQIEYTQKITLWYPANGTQDFVTVYYGERAIKVSFTARFDNTTIYNRWRNNTNDSLTFDVQGPIIGKLYTVSLGTPSAGTFTLTYNGQTTSGLAYNAPAATVQTALQGLSTIGSGNATVTGSAGGPYTVSFLNSLMNDGNALTGSGTGLTGGTFVITPTTYNQELNIVLPTISYDDVEHDTSKDNVLIKAKATAIVPAGSSLITGFVQNTVTSYTA